MVPKLILVRDNLTHRATLIALALTPDGCEVDVAWSQAQTKLDEAEARLARERPDMPVAPPSSRQEPTPSMSDAAYCVAVERAQRYITSGDAIQIVLSRRFRQDAEGLHPFLVYRALRGLNPSPYML